VIGINSELAKRQKAGRPVKVGLIGAGQMGVDVVAQVTRMKGIGRLTSIALQVW